MKIEQVQDKIREYKKKGGLITNYITGAVPAGTDVEFVEEGNNLVFWCPERFRVRAFYAGCDEKEISSLLKNAPDECVLEEVYRELGNNTHHSIIEEGGFTLCDTAVRKSFTYHTHPGTIPETGKRKLLVKLYDPTFGEMAKEEDAEELFEINKEVFDPQVDEVMTLDEWREVIQKKECILFRAKGKIVTYYVFRKEGTKLYSHLSVNKGPANFLYNIERRIFEECWKEGMRTNYWWVSLNNESAMTRMNEHHMDAVKHASFIYNDIFIKREKNLED